MKTLATYSIKGGVGKTTTAVNLSYEASRQGWRVVLWDLDPQGAATFFARVRPRLRGGAERLLAKRDELDRSIRATDHPGLHVVPADFSLRHLDLHLDDLKRPTRRLARLLTPLADHYDLVVIDCAPGITQASESVFGAADALLVPTIPTPLSRRTLDQLDAFLSTEHRAPTVLPFLSMVDRRKRLHRELGAELLDGDPRFLPTAIPNASVIERMGDERSPVGVYAPRSAIATAYADLWRDVTAVLAP